MTVPLRPIRVEAGMLGPEVAGGDAGLGPDQESPDAPPAPIPSVRAPVALRSTTHPSRRSSFVVFVGADIISVAAALVLAQLIAQEISGGHDLAVAVTSASYTPLYILVMGCYGLYRRTQRRLVGSSFPDFGQIVHSLALSSLLVLVGASTLHRWIDWPSVDRTGAVFAGILAVLMVPQARAAARYLLLHPRNVESKVLIIGTGQVAGLVVQRLAKVSGVRVVGCVDDNVDINDRTWPEGRWLGGLGDLAAVIDRWDIDHVIVAFSAANEAGVAAELRVVPANVRISVVPRMFDLLTVRSNVDDLRGLPVVDVAPPHLGTADRLVKRVMDIVLSGIALLVLFPLISAIAIAVRATSPGPVLFSQLRTGRQEKPFRIHKFRTMYIGSDDLKLELANEVDGPIFKVREDPRTTAVGRFLRRTSLDELPQLINVLFGTMSLVGPRPFIPSEAAQIEGWASRRFDVRPGITGLWQVSGRNDLPFDELCRLDYAYVSSWSLWWDLSILWRTPISVFLRDGAY